jgi:hypothetical protein
MNEFLLVIMDIQSWIQQYVPVIEETEAKNAILESRNKGQRRSKKRTGWLRSLLWLSIGEIYMNIKTETIILTITLALTIALVRGLVVIAVIEQARPIEDGNTLAQVHHKAKHIKKDKHNI